jgi:hypothetical protein
MPVKRGDKKELLADQSRIYDLLYGTSEGLKKKKAVEEEREHWYVGFARFACKYMGKSAKKTITPKYANAIAFLGWRLKPEEMNSATDFTMYGGLALAVVWAMLNFAVSGVLRTGVWVNMAANSTAGQALFGFGRQADVLYLLGPSLSPDPVSLIWYMGPAILALYLWFFIQSLPLKEVEKERIRALTFIPQIVNYLVMSMKVTPNLERAIAFAAEHGGGRIAKDFKDLQYDIHTGKYKTVEEALDNLAWRWGGQSEEFKHALMMIRSSVMEADETKRDALLDKAVTDVLEGIQEKMDFYSRSMHSPSIYLYYFGVLLPLLLIIIIPVGAMMGGGGISILAGFLPMMLIYNVLIPVASLVMANGILEKRPPTRAVPKIPDDMPGLPNPGWFKVGKSQVPVLLICALLFAGIAIGGLLVDPILNPAPPEWKQATHVPVLMYGGFVVGAVTALSFWLWASSKDRRKLQKEIVAMENEFQDTLYVIASRLGEGRPMEDALKHAAEFLPDSPATKMIFMPTLQNVVMMGMTIRGALFDEAYGSLRWLPSPFIRGTMLIVVDSLGLGVQTAARSLVSLSLQLRDSQRVEKALKAMLEDITNMLSAMCTFIAPIVLGITVALQQIIYGALKSMAKTMGGESMTGSGGAVSGLAFQPPKFGSTDVLATSATQEQLLFIITLYMIEIVAVLIYFASNVNEGKNELGFKMALAQALPISISLFFIIVFVAMKMTAIGL